MPRLLLVVHCQRLELRLDVDLGLPDDAKVTLELVALRQWGGHASENG